MFKTLAKAWSIKDLRDKLLFVLAIILVYRIGTSIPVPFVYSTAISLGSSSTIFGFLNTLAGGALEQGSLFALGVSPYITASIVVQLLTVAIPALERLSKLGEEGKKKINFITRILTIAISIVSAIGYYLILKKMGALTPFATEGAYWGFAAVVIVACYVAGSCVVMWLGEKINEHGIGNGISIILFANIVSRGGPLLLNFISMFQYEYYNNTHVIGSAIFTVLAIVAMLAMIWFVIYISDSERRIPVQYAKRVVGRKMYGGQNSNIPLKVNMAGVMPIIFANAILTLPSTIAMIFTPEAGSFWEGVVNFFSNTSPVYAILQFVLILAFAYFYVAISFNPTEVSGNIQKNGGAVPGIRPGKATADFIKKVLSKVTFIGAISLSIIAVLPLVAYLILNAMTGIDAAGAAVTFTAITSYASELAFSGTSVVIVVGVIIETVKEIEAQMTMRNYKGFLG